MIAKTKDGWPDNNSQQKSRTKEIRAQRERWLSKDIAPIFQSALDEAKLYAPDNSALLIEYAVQTTGTSYVLPRVLLEFGTRSTGEPAKRRAIVCAASHLPQLAFSVAEPRVMLATRTFWEKARAIHVYCRQGRSQGGDRSRHWYDLVRLDDAGIADQAITDPKLARDAAPQAGLLPPRRRRTQSAGKFWTCSVPSFAQHPVRTLIGSNQRRFIAMRCLLPSWHWPYLLHVRLNDRSLARKYSRMNGMRSGSRGSLRSAPLS